MDNQLVWKDEYNIGVDIIDREHQRLFKIINTLFAFGRKGKEQGEKSRWACHEGIQYFKEHAMKHFAAEEEYMESIGYKGFLVHRRIHDGFRINTLPALERELEQSGYSPEAVDHFLGVCVGWLIGHTLTEDRAIVGEELSKWTNLLPQEEQEAMEKVIIRLLYDMFRLESRVVSENYGGEKFGRGVYYRLVYGTGQEEKKWEIFLVFEEKLLSNTLGKVLGTQAGKLDAMLLNAVRYMARQLVGCVREHLPDAQMGDVEEENLLTYEQFQKVFEREKPQFSLLFDTGQGYFAYCAIAPHLPGGRIGMSIDADNVLSEVEEYLQKREAHRRKESSRQKILVVDDSATVRQAMRELLGSDYEVSVANSGTSAFRAITLDKPNLVLLDYEMPVCDGKQALQMIRSEEEFVKIPVFFLTSRTDPESIRTVISLKPDGYLSKSLRSGEIKKKIDSYFEKKKVGV